MLVIEFGIFFIVKRPEQQYTLQITGMCSHFEMTEKAPEFEVFLAHPFRFFNEISVTWHKKLEYPYIYSVCVLRIIVQSAFEICKLKVVKKWTPWNFK